MDTRTQTLVNIGSGDIGKLVEAYAMAAGMTYPSEEEIHESNGGTAHPWFAWYVRGLEAICNDDIESLRKATKSMVEIYAKVVEDEESD